MHMNQLNPGTQKSKKTESRKKKFSRRDFLISLGAGTAAIAGYMILADPPVTSEPESVAGWAAEDGQADKKHASYLPRLVDDACIEQVDGMCRLSRTDSETKCVANAPGELVLKNLDGKHGLEDITLKLAASINQPCTEETGAKVAMFIAQVAMAGFLTEPFHVNIFEVRQS